MQQIWSPETTTTVVVVFISQSVLQDPHKTTGTRLRAQDYRHKNTATRLPPQDYHHKVIFTTNHKSVVITRLNINTEHNFSRSTMVIVVSIILELLIFRVVTSEP